MNTHVGNYLKNARESKNITFQDIEKATRIRAKNLQALEQEQWDQFPSKTYVQGLLKKYAKFLELDEEKLLAYFRREYDLRESLKFKKRTSREQFTPQTIKVFRLSMLMIIIIFLSYFGFQIFQYNQPPEVIIIQPNFYEFEREDKVLLKGQTEKDTIVTINGERVYLDDDNIFEANIPLAEPENIVVIEATGANGKVTRIENTYVNLSLK